MGSSPIKDNKMWVFMCLVFMVSKLNSTIQMMIDFFKHMRKIIGQQ